jgi:hypothetical protein
MGDHSHRSGRDHRSHRHGHDRKDKKLKTSRDAIYKMIGGGMGGAFNVAGNGLKSEDDCVARGIMRTHGCV